MSVLKNKRKASGMEFVNTARKLEELTLQRSINFPKRYSFLFTDDFVALSVAIYNDVIDANRRNPVNQHEAQQRRDLLLDAYSKLYDMVAQLEIASHLFGVPATVLLEWTDLINTEIKLVHGLMKSDRERYKSLP